MEPAFFPGWHFWVYCSVCCTEVHLQVGCTPFSGGAGVFSVLKDRPRAVCEIYSQLKL